jgi:hypothetical protein
VKWMTGEVTAAMAPTNMAARTAMTILIEV